MHACYVAVMKPAECSILTNCKYKDHFKEIFFQRPVMRLLQHNVWKYNILEALHAYFLHDNNAILKVEGYISHTRCPQRSSAVTTWAENVAIHDLRNRWLCGNVPLAFMWTLNLSSITSDKNHSDIPPIADENPSTVPLFRTILIVVHAFVTESNI